MLRDIKVTYYLYALNYPPNPEKGKEKEISMQFNIFQFGKFCNYGIKCCESQMEKVVLILWVRKDLQEVRFAVKLEGLSAFHLYRI